MTKRLIKVISQLELDLTSEEIADILWFAPFLDESTGVVEPIAKKTPTPDNKAKRDSENKTKKQKTPTQTPQQSEDSGADVYSNTSGTDEAGEPGFGSMPFRSPGVAALPNSLKIGRALRPLLRKVPSQTDFVLDEEKTVRQIIDNKVWLPVLRPEPTRWLELVLVIDENPTMAIWDKTIAEFQTVLENLGAFRNIRSWAFQFDNETKSLKLYPKGALQSNTSHRPSELISPKSNQLILILSDCISYSWATRQINQAIKVWADQSIVALVQLLPESLWKRTALDEATRVFFHSQKIGQANKHLEVQYPLAWLDKIIEGVQEGEDKSSDVKLPLVTLEAESLLPWSKAVAGMGSLWVEGVMLPTKQREIKLQTTKNPQSDSVDVKERVQEFGQLASPNAWQLAGYLASVPINVPIIRLVNSVMFKEDGEQSAIAELMLSGLLKRVTPIGVGVSPEEVEYDFVEGARDVLLGTTSKSATEKVLTSVSDFIDRNSGQSLDFKTLLADPNAIDGLKITTERQPFARLAINALRRMGGRYETLATKLTRVSEQTIQSELLSSINSSEIVTEELDIGSQSLEVSQQTLYALFVGIDKYKAVGDLAACQNDVEAFTQWLDDANSLVNVKTKLLLNQDATYENVKKGIVDHLGQASTNDIVLLYFSGHGTAERVSEKQVDLFPDIKSDESVQVLVCHDSYTPGVWGLSIREIEYLFESVFGGSMKVPPISIIVDADFSYSNNESVVRQQSPRLGSVPYILFNASSDGEHAYETWFEEKKRGLFSYHLLQTLELMEGTLSYSEIHDIVLEKVSKNHNQHPQLKSVSGVSLKSKFLGGFFQYEPTSPKTSSFEISKLQVGFTGSETASSYLNEAISCSFNNEQPSLYIELTDANSDYIVRAVDDIFYLLRSGDDGKFITSIEGYSEDSAIDLVDKLEHIARWHLALDLKNPSTQLHSDDVQLVLTNDGKQYIDESIELILNESHIDDDGDYGINVSFSLRLSNNYSEKDLYCSLVAFSEDFEINTDIFNLPSMRLSFKDSIYDLTANGDDPIFFYVPKAVAAELVKERTDIIKLIVSTEPFDIGSISQKPLSNTNRRVNRRKLEGTPTSEVEKYFEHIMRKTFDVNESHKKSGDWFAKTVSVTLKLNLIDKETSNFEVLNQEIEQVLDEHIVNYKSSRLYVLGYDSLEHELIRVLRRWDFVRLQKDLETMGTPKLTVLQMRTLELLVIGKTFQQIALYYPDTQPNTHRVRFATITEKLSNIFESDYLSQSKETKIRLLSERYEKSDWEYLFEQANINDIDIRIHAQTKRKLDYNENQTKPIESYGHSVKIGESIQIGLSETLNSKDRFPIVVHWTQDIRQDVRCIFPSQYAPNRFAEKIPEKNRLIFDVVGIEHLLVIVGKKPWKYEDIGWADFMEFDSFISKQNIYKLTKKDISKLADAFDFMDDDQKPELYKTRIIVEA